MIPGTGLLNIALSMLGKQTLTYLQSKGYSIDAQGDKVPAYLTGVTVIECSFQPIPRRLYEDYGLDFQKEYFNWFVSQTVIDVGRANQGDQVQFNTQTFNCQSVTPWEGIDGWVQVLCVAVTS